MSAIGQKKALRRGLLHFLAVSSSTASAACLFSAGLAPGIFEALPTASVGKRRLPRAIQGAWGGGANTYKQRSSRGHGYKWKRKQMEELARRKCPLVVNGAGKLIALRHDLFGSGEEKGEEPDWDAI